MALSKKRSSSKKTMKRSSSKKGKRTRVKGKRPKVNRKRPKVNRKRPRVYKNKSRKTKKRTMKGGTELTIKIKNKSNASRTGISKEPDKGNAKQLKGEQSFSVSHMNHEFTKETPIKDLIFEATLHVMKGIVSPADGKLISSTVKINDIIIATFNLKELEEKSEITIIDLLTEKNMTYSDDIEITILLSFK